MMGALGRKGVVAAAMPALRAKIFSWCEPWSVLQPCSPHISWPMLTFNFTVAYIKADRLQPRQSGRNLVVARYMGHANHMVQDIAPLVFPLAHFDIIWPF